MLPALLVLPALLIQQFDTAQKTCMNADAHTLVNLNIPYVTSCVSLRLKCLHTM